MHQNRNSNVSVKNTKVRLRLCSKMDETDKDNFNSAGIEEVITLRPIDSKCKPYEKTTQLRIKDGRMINFYISTVELFYNNHFSFSSSKHIF